MSEEIWEDIDGFEGLYKVSNRARIKSVERYTVRAHNATQVQKEIVLKPRYNSSGYLTVNLYKHKKQHTKTIHRLVALAFIPNPNKLPFINHINGLKDDNRLDNLEWCTPSQNVLHAIKIGNMTPLTGESAWNCKLSDADINNILSKKGSVSALAVSSVFGISKRYVLQIWKGKARRYIHVNTPFKD